MNMQNIVIEVMRENYIQVRADTARFGVNEVMCECNTFDQAFDYIKRETGQQVLSLRGTVADGIYEDRMGRCFPTYMKVVV